ncbi:MAG: hypothetical protein R2880_16095 [Deinococcales bacterium]
MSEKTYSDREIVLELFPATHEKLIPQERLYSLEELGSGMLQLKHIKLDKAVLLSPVDPSGSNSSLLCCDLCKHQALRSQMQIYRAHAEGQMSYRYISLCRQRKACLGRYILHEPIEIIERLFDLAN